MVLPDLEKADRLCKPRWIHSRESRLGLTFQARQRGSVCVVLEELIAPLFLRRPQRLHGFYDRESAARCAANFMSGLCLTASGLANKINAPQSIFYPQSYPHAVAVKKQPESAKVPDFRPKLRRDGRDENPAVDNNDVSSISRFGELGLDSAFDIEH